MRETRRKFVLALAAAAGCFTAQDALLFAQRRQPFPDPPEPAEHQNPADSGPQTPGHLSSRKLLLENEREFRAGIERLYQLTGELRDELQKTATRDVLSIRMYKKTEEIEKLAKQLKNKAKG